MAPARGRRALLRRRRCGGPRRGSRSRAARRPARSRPAARCAAAFGLRGHRAKCCTRPGETLAPARTRRQPTGGRARRARRRASACTAKPGGSAPSSIAVAPRSSSRLHVGARDDEGRRGRRGRPRSPGARARRRAGAPADGRLTTVSRAPRGRRRQARSRPRRGRRSRSADGASRVASAARAPSASVGVEPREPLGVELAAGLARQRRVERDEPQRAEVGRVLHRLVPVAGELEGAAERGAVVVVPGRTCTGAPSGASVLARDARTRRRPPCSARSPRDEHRVRRCPAAARTASTAAARAASGSLPSQSRAERARSLSWTSDERPGHGAPRLAPQLALDWRRWSPRIPA